jgi:hypothetical protein
MVRLRTVVVTGALAMVAAVCDAQPRCSEPPFLEQQLKEIVAKARAERKDLPPAFAQAEFAIRRLGCHTEFIERALPRRPEEQNVFLINQHGVIVDAQPEGMACPGRVFSENELAEIVKKERARRTDLPPPYPNAQPRVTRSRCLFLYIEYAVPEQRGQFQVFTIDPFGELVEAFRNKPQ